LRILAEESLDIEYVIFPEYVLAFVVNLFAGTKEGKRNDVGMIVAESEYLVTRDSFQVVIDAAKGYDSCWRANSVCKDLIADLWGKNVEKGLLWGF